jgi:hypothetical protein
LASEDAKDYEFCYTYVGELKMAAPSEEKLICDNFNLEALTVNQVKSFKALADGKDVFIGTKTGSGIFVYISSKQNDSDWLAMTTI